MEYSCRIKSGSVQQANQIIYNGASVKDIEHIAERVASERGKQQITAITRVEDIEKLIVSNPKYSIPLAWNGTQEEYDKLNADNEVISNAFYMISD